MAEVVDLALPGDDHARVIEYRYDAAPTLAQFAADDFDLRIVMGPFGSGKTSACVMEFIRRAQLQPLQSYGRRHARFLVVRNSYRQLLDTTIRTTLAWLPESVFGRYHKSDMTYVIDQLPGLHIELLFRALDRPEHVQNLLSLEVTGAYINEVREMRWAIIEALFGRVGRYPSKNQGGCNWSGIWADTNPPGRSHWMYRRFEEQEPPKMMRLYKQPSGLSEQAENKQYLPDGYYERMTELMDEESARVYVHGEYGIIKAGKPVFPQFSERYHVKEGLHWSGKGRLWRGWDFGLTPACVIAEVAAHGQLRVLCEFTTSRAGIDVFAEYVLSECARRFGKRATFRDVADPSGRSGLPIQGKQQANVQTCFSILNGKGIYPDPADNSINMRLEAVRYGLRTIGDGGEPLLVIDSHNCIMLRDGLAGAYHYREVINLHTVGEKYAEEPEKNEYCVPLDVEALTTEGWKQHHEVAEGDLLPVYDIDKEKMVMGAVTAVNVFSGKREVTALRNSQMDFSSTAGHRHLIETKSGVRRFVETDDLRSGHHLLAPDPIYEPRKKRLFSEFFVRLSAWVAAEGTYRKDGSVVLTQSLSANLEYVADLDELLGSASGVVRSASGDNAIWRITKDLAWMLRQAMPGKVPTAEFIVCMNNCDRRAFLYEFLRADGNVSNGVGDPRMPTKARISRNRDFFVGDQAHRLYQRSEASVDALQMMATLAGLNASKCPTGKGWRLTIRRSARTEVSQARCEKEVVDGVWCPTTTHGTWVCRSHGRVFLTGNSHPMDALQYICEFVFGFLMRKEGQEVHQSFQDPSGHDETGGELYEVYGDDEDDDAELQEFQLD